MLLLPGALGEELWRTALWITGAQTCSFLNLILRGDAGEKFGSSPKMYPG